MARNSGKPNQDFDYTEVMEDKAITNVAGWIEPNNDLPCDEKEYRRRLEKNGPIFQQKAQEVFNFE